MRYVARSSVVEVRYTCAVLTRVVRRAHADLRRGCNALLRVSLSRLSVAESSSFDFKRGHRYFYNNEDCPRKTREGSILSRESQVTQGCAHQRDDDSWYLRVVSPPHTLAMENARRDLNFRLEVRLDGRSGARSLVAFAAEFAERARAATGLVNDNTGTSVARTATAIARKPGFGDSVQTFERERETDIPRARAFRPNEVSSGNNNGYCNENSAIGARRGKHAGPRESSPDKSSPENIRLTGIELRSAWVLERANMRACAVRVRACVRATRS